MQEENSGRGVIAIIPARYQSSRFPGKPLATIAGKPMIQHVYENTARAEVARVVVATDDERIRRCVCDFGGEAVMTSARHATGTDRIAEALGDRRAELVLNVQGDEPLIPPEIINRLIAGMQANPAAQMGTMAVPIDPDTSAFTDPNVVKVVCDQKGFALYFSRAPIPCDRDHRGSGVVPLHHWGLYAYRRAFLQQFIAWPQGALEKSECLEQLRALEHGARILVLQADRPTIGVDTPADLELVETILAKKMQSS